MATVKQVIHGTLVLDDTETSEDVTLSPSIDTSKAFLVFGVSQNENTPQEDAVCGRIVDSTTLRFSRHTANSGNASITIRYHLVEFDTGVFVQHGTLSSPVNGNNDITLATAVDTGRSVSLLSVQSEGPNFDNDDFYRAEMLASDTLRIDVTQVSNTYLIAWQVIEFTDSTVQSGSVSFGSTDTVQTDTLSTTVDPDKSWLTLSYASNGGTFSNIGQKLVRGELSGDGTTVTFTRENDGHSIDLTYYVVEFTDDTTVQRGSVTLAATDGEEIVSLTAVNPDHAIPVAAGIYDRSGSSAYSTDDYIGVSVVRMSFLSGGASLALNRDTTDDAATIIWQVIEFDAQSSGGGSGGTGSGTLGTLSQDWVDDNDDLRVRFTEAGQVQVGDFQSGMLATEDALIEAHRSETSSLPERGIHSLGRVASAIVSAIAWTVFELELIGTAAISSLQTAVRGRLTHSSTGDSSKAELRAGDFETINQSGSSSTPVGSAVAVQGTVDNQAAAYLTKASGVVAQVQNASGADIETAIGFEVATPINDGTIDTLVGVEVPDIDQGTANYAIRTGKGIVQLGDVLELPQQTGDPANKASVVQVYSKDDKLFAKAPDPDNTVYDLTQGVGGGAGGSLEYLNSYDLTTNTVAQWDIALPTGYKMIRMQLWLQTATGNNRILYLRLDDEATAGDYSMVGHNATAIADSEYSAGTAEIRAGTVVRNTYTVPFSFVELEVWDYEDANRNTIIRYHTTLLESAPRSDFIGTGHRRVTEANSTLNLTMNADNFGACRAVLWGLKEA